LDIRRDRRGEPLIDEGTATRLQSLFLDLVCLMRRLRSECPWDREQTPQSLARYVLEETYEVLETIEKSDWPALKDELGDHLLQTLFQARIQEERGNFALSDVLEGLKQKLIRRHPHVFDEPNDIDVQQVRANWERIKEQEKTERKRFDGIPAQLPALMAAYKMGAEVAGVGFDWSSSEDAQAKVIEELGEVQHAKSAGDPSAVAEEVGDLLFAVAQVARKLGVEPEQALRQANRKFAARFTSMESAAERPLTELSLDEMEAIWQGLKTP